MTFTHEGNKTFIDNMVNFEKMVSVFFVLSHQITLKTCSNSLFLLYKRKCLLNSLSGAVLHQNVRGKLIKPC